MYSKLFTYNLTNETLLLSRYLSKDYFKNVFNIKQKIEISDFI
jgi:hypothetical protein